jgi:hypothetical protein
MVMGRETVWKGVEEEEEESASVGSIERALIALLFAESLESEGIEDAVVVVEEEWGVEMGRALVGVQVERAKRQTKVEGVKSVFIDSAGGGFVLAIVR